jgi:hypothetical protein
VLRGIAAVYQAQALAGGDRRTLLTQALVELQKAQAIDPRDPRTALDQSQLHRLAGNLEAAAKFAMAAASVEPLPGPASRALPAILVARARREHQAGRAKEAKALAATARLYDPGSAARPSTATSPSPEDPTRRRPHRAALTKEPARRGDRGRRRRAPQEGGVPVLAREVPAPSRGTASRLTRGGRRLGPQSAARRRSASSRSRRPRVDGRGCGGGVAPRVAAPPRRRRAQEAIAAADVVYADGNAP